MSDEPQPPKSPSPDTGRFGIAGTPDERRDSKVLMEALGQRKDELGAAAQLPPEDRALSERILGEARRRSEQISGSDNPAASARTPVAAERIPWWIYVAWIIAIVGSILAFRYWL